MRELYHSLVATRIQPSFHVRRRHWHKQVREHAMHMHARLLAARSYTEETGDGDLLDCFAMERRKHAVLMNSMRAGGTKGEERE